VRPVVMALRSGYDFPHPVLQTLSQLIAKYRKLYLPRAWTGRFTRHQRYQW
jgi:hypothetical protein